MPMASGPDRYLVVGNPIAHSRSPAIHQMFAAQEGTAIEYERLLAERGCFAQAAAAFFAAGGIRDGADGIFYQFHSSGTFCNNRFDVFTGDTTAHAGPFPLSGLYIMFRQ